MNSNSIVEALMDIYRVVQNIATIILITFGGWQTIKLLIRLNRTHSDYQKTQIYKKILGVAVIIIFGLIIVWFIFPKLMV